MLKTKKAKIILAIFIITILIITAILIYSLYNRCGDEVYDEESDKLLELTWQHINASEARAKLEQDDSIILLDVRTIEEHEEQRIPNSILIPVDELQGRGLNELQDKQAIIIVYCRSGVRSVSAATMLVELGFENVYDMGGILYWPYETE